MMAIASQRFGTQPSPRVSLTSRTRRCKSLEAVNSFFRPRFPLFSAVLLSPRSLLVCSVRFLEITQSCSPLAPLWHLDQARPLLEKEIKMSSVKPRVEATSDHASRYMYLGKNLEASCNIPFPDPYSTRPTLSEFSTT